MAERVAVKGEELFSDLLRETREVRGGLYAEAMARVFEDVEAKDGFAKLVEAGGPSVGKAVFWELDFIMLEEATRMGEKKDGEIFGKGVDISDLYDVLMLPETLEALKKVRKAGGDESAAAFVSDLMYVAEAEIREVAKKGTTERLILGMNSLEFLQTLRATTESGGKDAGSGFLAKFEETLLNFDDEKARQFVKIFESEEVQNTVKKISRSLGESVMYDFVKRGVGKVYEIYGSGEAIEFSKAMASEKSIEEIAKIEDKKDAIAKAVAFLDSKRENWQ